MLNITTAATLEVMADRCATVLATPPTGAGDRTWDPFEPEWIATPTGRVRGWLARRLAARLGATHPDRRDGVVANVDFVRSGTLFRRLRGFGTATSSPQEDPWSAAAMTWRLMELVAGGRIDRQGRPVGGPAAPSPVEQVEPLATWAARQARRFDRYHVYRPDLIRAWGQNHDPDPVEATQARLYRALVAAIPIPDPVTAIDTWLAAGQRPAGDLPGRLVFFGFMLPPEGHQFVEVITRIAQERDVHCYFLDPAPGLAVEARSGLTARWCRADIAASSLPQRTPGAVWHVQPPVADDDDAVLDRLRTLVATGRVARRSVEPTDDSVVVHDCHGLTRQVEVLRDEILHRLARNDRWTEEDIVVFCADPEAVAPVVTSVLGVSARPGETTPAGRTPRLRYHIDGLSARETNPVADAFAHLLELLTGRVTSLDLVQFCQREAVRNRWGFDDDDIEALRSWAARMHVRWGLDPRHRARFGIPETLTMGTWGRALDRLALGVAFAGDDLVLERDDGPTAPAAVEGDDIARLGWFTELVGRIRELAEQVDRELPAVRWMALLADAATDLFAPTAGRTEQLDRVLAACRVPPAGVEDPGFTISLNDLRPHLLSELERHGGGSARFEGGVTFTTPDAVRGMPYRMVALLDLGDHWIPAGTGDGGDLMSLDLRPGDPEPRTDARASLLATILTARDALVVTRNAKSLATNQDTPEGVIVGELFDALTQCIDPRADRERLTRRHGRRATDPAAFDAPAPWSFDVVACRAAQDAAAGLISAWPVPADTPLHRRIPAPTAGGVVDLDELCGFLRDPFRYVVGTTMGVRVPYDRDELDDALATALDPRQRHRLRARLLEALEADATDVPILERFRADDALAVGRAGDVEFAVQRRHVEHLLATVETFRRGRQHVEVDVDVALPDGRRLRGRVPCLVDAETGIIVDHGVTSKARFPDRLRALTLLHAVTATTAGADPPIGDPDRLDWWTVVVRYDRSDHVDRFHQRLPRSPQRRADSVAALQGLVRLLDLTRIGAVPLATRSLGDLGTFPPSWQSRFLDEFVARGDLRILFGYRDVEHFRNLPVHPDDPRPGPDTAENPVHHDRADLLRSVVVDDLFAGLFRSVRRNDPALKRLVDHDG